MIFNNKFKRAGFIFPMMMAFSYNVGAMEALEGSKDPPPAQYTDYYLITKRNEETGKKEEFTILGTTHNLPAGILSEEIRKDIKKRHDFCLKEFVNNKLLDSYQIALQVALEKNKALLDQYEPLRQEFLANREAWLKTVDTPSLSGDMMHEGKGCDENDLPRALSNDTSSVSEEIKSEGEECDLSYPPPEGMIKFYEEENKKLEEENKKRELGFQLLFPDLVQGDNPLTFASLNEIGLGKLDSACCDTGFTKQYLEQYLEQRKLEREKNETEKKKPHTIHYYIDLEYLRQQYPGWFKPDGDTTDYLVQLKESQRAILNGMFANPLELVHFNLDGLFRVHNKFLRTNGMDDTIEYWVKYSKSLDDNAGCRKILSIDDDYKKFLGLSRESYNFHPTKNEISELRDKLKGLNKELTQQFHHYTMTEKLKHFDIIESSAWKEYAKLKSQIQERDEKLKGAFDTFESRLKVLKEKFQKLGYDPDHKPSTSDIKPSIFPPHRPHTIKALGEMLEQKWPDGTYEYLNVDAALYYKNDPYHKEPVVADRNKLWIPIILEHSQQIANGTLLDPVTKDRLEKMIVVCGCAHLYDGLESKGILRLLHEQGYTIKRATPELEWLPFFTDEPLTIESTQKPTVEESKNP